MGQFVYYDLFWYFVGICQSCIGYQFICFVGFLSFFLVCIDSVEVFYQSVFCGLDFWFVFILWYCDVMGWCYVEFFEGYWIYVCEILLCVFYYFVFVYIRFGVCFVFCFYCGVLDGDDFDVFFGWCSRWWFCWIGIEGIRCFGWDYLIGVEFYYFFGGCYV